MYQAFFYFVFYANSEDLFVWPKKDKPFAIQIFIALAALWLIKI